MEYFNYVDNALLNWALSESYHRYILLWISSIARNRFYLQYVSNIFDALSLWSYSFTCFNSELWKYHILVYHISISILKIQVLSFYLWQFKTNYVFYRFWRIQTRARSLSLEKGCNFWSRDTKHPKFAQNMPNRML